MALRKYEAPRAKRLTCVECDKPCAFVRCTQFAGDHFYCQEHAEAESDFGKPDPTGWHHAWCTVEQYTKASQ
jgi:hypothetical protein